MRNIQEIEKAKEVININSKYEDDILKIMDEDPNEEWRFIYIPKREICAFVSSEGRIVNRYGKLHKKNIQNNGYLSYRLTTVHRLVAYAFGLLKKIDYDGYTDVDHKDGNKLNCKLSNLEVIPHSENIKRRDQFGSPLAVKIDMYNLKGEYIKSFDSILEASNETGIKSPNICNTCRGKINSTGGFVFKYAKEGK